MSIISVIATEAVIAITIALVVSVINFCIFQVSEYYLVNVEDVFDPKKV